MTHHGAEEVRASAELARQRAEIRITRYSRIFEDSLNEIFIFSVETLKFVQVNNTAQENLGYSMDEFLEMTPLDLKPEYTAETFAKLIVPLRTGEEHMLVFETVHKRKDNSLYDVEVHLQLIRHEYETLFTAIVLDITERKHSEKQLSFQASHDALTGLINRREFERRAERLLATIQLDKTEHAFCFMDLDQFKLVNDTCGHHAGDEMLRQLSTALKKCCTTS